MRIAIFHDYIGAIGGGERVVLMLARALHADLVTTDLNLDTLRRLGFGDVKVISLGSTMKTPPLKQISASVLFSLCDLSDDYDFFILSGNWAQYAGRRHRPNLWYCHTPARAFYDLRDVVVARQPDSLRRALASAWIACHRWFDQRSLRHVDKIATNSLNVSERIKKFYGRPSTIAYPPVETSRFRFEEYGDFWLSVNRIYPEKRIELQIDAFRALPDERLVIVGGYSPGDHAAGYYRSLLESLPKNVEMAGEVSEEELIDLYARCRGLICTALDEDFGLTPLEAMASGKPVVAVDEGGFRETVLDGRTGILAAPDGPSLARAVIEASRDISRYRNNCISRAREFDTSVFLDKMARLLPAESGLIGQ